MLDTLLLFTVKMPLGILGPVQLMQSRNGDTNSRLFPQMLTQELAREDPPHGCLSVVCFSQCQCITVTGSVSDLRRLSKHCQEHLLLSRNQYFFWKQLASEEMTVVSRVFL